VLTDVSPSQSHDGREERLETYIVSLPEFLDIHGHPDKVLAAIDEFSASREFLMNVGSHKGKIINDIISATKPKVFIEFGSYLGYSAIFFANEMRKYQSSSTKPQYYSLEFNPTFAAIASKLIAIAGLDDIVTVVVGSAEDSIKKLHAEGKLTGIDLMFLDHAEELYTRDFQVCESLGLFKKGSMIIADNVVRPGAPEYRAFVRAHPKLKSEGIRGLILPGEFEVSSSPHWSLKFG
jgi:catechol O-methyltransferase